MRETEVVRRRRLVIVLGLGAFAAIMVVWRLTNSETGGAEVRPSQGVAGEDPPSIVLILTDDQRWDTLWAMPMVRRHLVDRGIEFTNSFVVNPLCCPSRASTLTGTYPHTTGVWANKPPHGGFSRFRDQSTIATWLHAQGYHTALFGMYLNGYEGTTYVPPGWDRWVAFTSRTRLSDLYYEYRLASDGHITRFGAGPEDYSTDVLADRAVSYIQETKGSLFVYFAPRAPHLPAIPAPRDVGALSQLKPWRSRSYNEANVSDKPSWLRGLLPLEGRVQQSVDDLRRDQLAALLAVDRAVGRIIDALGETGRLDNTMIVFTSDNGFSWGEHRWVGKLTPWEESIRVPLVVRFDPMIERARSDSHPVLNIDLAPTFAQVGGIQVRGVEGVSLVPLIAEEQIRWRANFGIESMKLEWLTNLVASTKPGPQISLPGYCALRTKRYKFVAYTNGELELYDLKTDRFETRNRASDPSLAALVRRLEGRVQEVCDPPPPLSPPGFPPSPPGHKP
jgi:N-acetylglucosamine-6-sulfatase